MSRPAAHQSSIPANMSPPGGMITHLWGDPMIQAPCKRRPDTGEPCFLINHPKDNWVCDNCGLIPNKGHLILTSAEIRKAMKSKGFVTTENTSPGPVPKKAHRKSKPCNFKKCRQKISKGKYCSPHGKLVRGRKRRWKAANGDRPIPDDFLFRPSAGRGKASAKDFAKNQ